MVQLNLMNPAMILGPDEPTQVRLLLEGLVKGSRSNIHRIINSWWIPVLFAQGNRQVDENELS